MYLDDSETSSCGSDEDVRSDSRGLRDDPPRDRTGEQHCRVCGDRAKCCNFGVRSCESCKVFFRRSSLRNIHEHYKCLYKNCRITVQTRKLCQFCRFQKCKSLGMYLHCDPASGKTKETKRENADRRKCEKEDRVATLRNLDTSSNPSLPWVNPCAKFTDSDTAYLRSLLQSHYTTVTECPFPAEDLNNNIKSLREVMNLLDSVIKRVSAFAKSRENFKTLDMDDQVNLIKQGACEILLTRMAMPKFRQRVPGLGLVWCEPDTKRVIVPEKRVHEATGSTELTNSPYSLALLKLNLDDVALVICTCILLFREDRAGLKDPIAVGRAQRPFILLLQKYLKDTHGSEQAEVLFTEAMGCITLAKDSGRIFPRYIRTIPKDQVRPLVKECFDMR